MLAIVPVVLVVPLLASAPTKTSVLVLDLDAAGVGPDLALQVRRSVAESIAKNPEYSVLTLEDVKDLFSLDQSKQIVGCQSETSCLVEKTKAANSDLAVKGSVGLVGKSISVSLSLIDEKKVSVKNRVSVLAERPDLLRDTVDQAVRDLFGWSGSTQRAAFKLPSKKTSFAVFELVASGVAPDIVVNLTQILSVEIKRAEGATVIGRDDIKAMLALETQKQLLGCADDTSCLSEIGAALGVDYLVVGHVGKVAGTYVISLRLIAPDALRVENRVTESFTGREDQLVGAVKEAGRKLVGITASDKGTLALGANEEDADAYVDEASAGRLPLKPISLAPGRHAVRIAKSGYFDWNGDVYVDPAGATVLWAELEKRPKEWYETWWFWTLTGVAVVGTGAAIGFVAASSHGSSANQTFPFNFEASLPTR